MLLECPQGVTMNYDYKPCPVSSKPKITNEFEDLTGEDM